MTDDEIPEAEIMNLQHKILDTLEPHDLQVMLTAMTLAFSAIIHAMTQDRKQQILAIDYLRDGLVDQMTPADANNAPDHTLN